MDKLASRLEAGTGRLSKVLGAIAGVVGLGIVGVVVYGVVVRYVFRKPTGYSLELPQVLFIALVALALAYAQVGGKHVRVDMAVQRLPQRPRDALFALTSLVTVGYCALVAWALWQRGIWNLARGMSTVEQHIPLAPFNFVSVVGLCLLALLVLIETAKAIARVVRRNSHS